jgi:hypothetical protein
MSRKAISRPKKSPSARTKAIRRRAAEWGRKARRAATLALIAAGTTAVSVSAHAQTGQVAMAPAAGIVPRAMNAFQSLNENGPGFLYYGFNGADRGLGYVGSYFTIGGYVPYAEDDLGGLWAADLRGHLSVYGGFFSNIGAVRKQYLGGTLLGIGVYWDYDGDANQDWGGGSSCSAAGPFGQFGHTYNQVGVSGEWLTDFGNLRSNGYMPVGTTAYTAGSPDSLFFQNYVMCQSGLDAALTGADLEVGAYIPGLSDWAGMISVGGYALGNARYDWTSGPQAGQDVVPWFGGVYTRLDMTFLNNWDFSIQANNDSYFEWTGFARITYRMGGSRRRTVPDQMEQPMMRNEHIVRAHQTPIVAVNPSTGTPWRLIHVNNSAATAGDGTAESPFRTIVAANAAATNPQDIVLVNRGTGAAYAGTFSPLAADQYLVGDGQSFVIPSVCCGPVDIAIANNGVPVLSNPSGASVNLANGLFVGNFSIQNSAIGIGGTGNLSSAARGAVVNNVNVAGSGAGSRTGIALTNATGSGTFRDVNISGMTNGAIVVTGGSAVVDYAEGTLTNAQGHLLDVDSTTGGSVTLTANSTQPFNDSGDGISVRNAAGNVTVRNVVPGSRSAVISSQVDGISVVDSSGTQTFSGVTINAAGVSGPGFAAVNVQNSTGATSATNFNGLQISLTGTGNTAAGLLAANVRELNVAGNSSVNVVNGPAVSLTNIADANVTFTTVRSTNSPTNGILLDSVVGDFAVTGVTTITSATSASVAIVDSTPPGATGSISFNVLQIASRQGVGLLVDGVRSQVEINSLTIDNAASIAGDAVQITDTTNPSDPTGTGSGRVYIDGGSIANATGNGILVQNALAAITGVSITNFGGNGILATAGNGETTTVQATNNVISGTASGDGLRATALAGGRVNATATANQISVTGAASNSLQAIAAASGTISLAATGNSGVGGGAPGVNGFVLDNSGTLQISQTSTADLSSQNNGVTVSEPANPVTFSGTTPPVPPRTP